VREQVWIFWIVFPLYFVSLWLGISYILSAAGGWRRLARRFRTDSAFSGEEWSFQSANMRFRINYNGCLTVGSNTAGLFIKPMFLFRAWHPPLFVAWTEITRFQKKLMFWDVVEFRLGSEEQIPFTVRVNLAQKIRAAAARTGAAMPIE
jgi:hypothetical protein